MFLARVISSFTHFAYDELVLMLVHCMTLAMAARMAYAITQSASLEQTRLQELEMALKRARAIDGQDEPPETFGDNRLLGSRY